MTRHEVCITHSEVHSPGVIFARSKNTVFVYTLPLYTTFIGDRVTDFEETCIEHGFVRDRDGQYFTTEEKFQVFQDSLAEKGILCSSQFSLDGAFTLDNIKHRGNNRTETVSMYLPSTCPNFRAVSCLIESIDSAYQLEYRFFDMTLGILLRFVLYTDDVKRFGSNFSIFLGGFYINALNFDHVCYFICNKSNPSMAQVDSMQLCAFNQIKSKYSPSDNFP